MPPISPMKDGATGKTVKSATLTPLRTLELKEVYKLITANKRLIILTQAIREAALQGDDNNCRMLKQQTLPYVTPCGVFTRRRSDCLTESSGLVVVDIDHLESAEETENLRQKLFDDPYLCPALVFVSPTGRGVKAFVPCPAGQDSTEAVRWAMNYVHCMYDAENTQPGKGVDTSGKDLVRACFLCHDPKALLRKVVNFEL
ncbi:virulence protein E [Bacteroides sp. AM07-18]|nr:virulence protein E [Bacteroides sp. AM07-18]RJU79906.1 virulence protein E [Bacteroides sp. AM26-2]